jgi:hypothetical protein
VPPARATCAARVFPIAAFHETAVAMLWSAPRFERNIDVPIG